MSVTLSQTHYVPCGCRAHLSEKDPRSAIWLAVFGKLEFPLKHPLAKFGSGPGEAQDRFLEGDWEALSLEEQAMLGVKMREKFGVPDSVFISQVKALGYVPIKDRNITVVCCQLHSRMAML